MILLLLACRGREPAPAVPAAPAALDLPAALEATDRFLDTRPPHQRPVREAGVAPLDAGALSAESCGTCHRELVEEWRTSVHAAAWLDPQFQQEITKSGNRWLCLGCHTPLLVQQAEWPIGLDGGDIERPITTPAPVFDAALRDEGITCVACHLRDGKLHGPGRTTGAPHEVVADPAFDGPELCLGCHQAEESFPGKSFVCTFGTGDEWRAGAWSEQGVDCRHCHMPERPRVGADNAVRTGRAHWWKGAGIPKFADRYPPEEANRPGLALAARAEGDALLVTLTNAAAGHRLPTGDPERWVQVEVRFRAGAEPVGEPVVLRIGQVWAWETPPRKVSDNRLAPLESRVEQVPIPAGATEAELVGSSHRISEENAAFHRLEGYPRSVETHRLRVALP